MFLQRMRRYLRRRIAEKAGSPAASKHSVPGFESVWDHYLSQAKARGIKVESTAQVLRDLGLSYSEALVAQANLFIENGMPRKDAERNAKEVIDRAYGKS